MQLVTADANTELVVLRWKSDSGSMILEECMTANNEYEICGGEIGTRTEGNGCG